MKAEVTMTGRLTRDVTSIFTNEDGSAKRALFTVACNSSYKKEGEKIQNTDFIPCIAWGPMADLLEEWGLKGRLVAIRGNLESYQAPPDDDGAYAPIKIQVRIRELEFLGFEENVQEKFEAKKAEEVTQTKTSEAEDIAKALLGLLNKSGKKEADETKGNENTSLAEALRSLI